MLHVAYEAPRRVQNRAEALVRVVEFIDLQLVVPYLIEPPRVRPALLRLHVVVVDAATVLVNHHGNVLAGLALIDLVALEIFVVLAGLLLLLKLLRDAELLGHEVSIDLALLHDELKPLLL